MSLYDNILKGNIKEVQNSVTTENVNSKIQGEQTALMVAAECGQTDIVSYLLALGALPNIQTSEGYTALMFAARRGQVNVIEALINEHANLEYTVTNELSPLFGSTALRLAVMNGHKEAVALLLVKKAWIHNLTLLTAAELNYSDILSLLLSHSCYLSTNLTINAKDKLERTALMMVAKNGHSDFVTQLLKQGAEADLSDSSLTSTLMFAVESQSLEVVEQVLSYLKNDENIAAADQNGFTALMMAAQDGSSEIVSELLTRLKQCSINAKDEDGSTALMIATEENKPEVIELLLSRLDDAAINTADKKGNTALILATKMGSVEITRLLLSRLNIEAIDVKDGKGMTALMHAATHDDQTLLSLFLNRLDPKSINIVDNTGLTALDHAKNAGNENIVGLISAKGGASSTKLSESDAQEASEVEDAPVSTASTAGLFALRSNSNTLINLGTEQSAAQRTSSLNQ